MKQLVASALMLLSPVLVMAQDAAPAPAKPAPKAAAKAAPAKDSKEAKKPAAKSTQSAKAAPAKDAKKPVHVAKAHPQSSRAQLKSATNQVASGLIAAEAALSPAELEIAQRVHTGHIPCELGASVNIEADPKSPGYFEVAGKNFHYRMTPVATSTGAVRLEDQKAGAVWIQISNKSMLMNQKLGQRLADECMSPQQVAVSETIRKNPQPSLLDAPAPAPAAAAAPAAAPAAEAPAK